MAKTIKEMIEVMEWFEGGGEVEFYNNAIKEWEVAINPSWGWHTNDYRIKEFQYPMWFKAISSGLIIRFDSLQSGSVVENGTTNYNKGLYKNIWIPHTEIEHWEKIEEPKPKQKVTIEKWLIEDNDIKVVIETSDIDSWLKSFPTAKKLKLIESYEVEI